MAALGSTILVVSKRENSSFVASLIDWCLFANPYLFLHDVYLAVVEFEGRHELAGRLPELPLLYVGISEFRFRESKSVVVASISACKASCWRRFSGTDAIRSS